MTIPAAPSFPPILGESGGDRIVRIVRAFNGCSLLNRREDLAGLVCRGVDDESVVTWTTNCCTFALGVLAAAGCDFPALWVPLKNGMEFELLEDLGTYYQAWHIPSPGDVMPPGALIWYEISGENDDHVEFFLSAPDEHGGGGRTNNEITIGNGDFHTSWSRPIHKWLDPSSLRLPDAHVDG
jgi:hypothetical protein